MRRAFFYLAAIVLALVTLQFLLAGIGVFGAGSFAPHRHVGYTLPIPALAMVVAAVAGRLERPLVISAVALLALVAIQVGLPNAPDALAALHPLLALVTWVGAAHALSAARRLRGAVSPAG